MVVAFQETERMTGLTSEIRRTLKELDLGLKVRIYLKYNKVKQEAVGESLNEKYENY